MSPTGLFRPPPLLLALALVVLGEPAAADSPREVRISSRRVLLRDVVPTCSGPVCEVDLAAAPPAGSSRLLHADAMQRVLNRSGEDLAGVSLPRSVRLVSESRTWSPREWAEHVRPAIEAALPDDVSLISVAARGPLTLPLEARAERVELPRLPKRAGTFRTAATVEVEHEGSVVRRVPALLELSIGEQAARPDVARGQGVTLVIRRHTASISTQGTALKDVEVGEVAPFRVQRTGKVVQARVRSSTLALVLEER